MSAIPAHLPKNTPFGQLHETVRRVTRKTRQTVPRCVVRGLRTHAAMREGDPCPQFSIFAFSSSGEVCPQSQLHETARRVTRKTRQTMPVVRGLRTHAAMREGEASSRREKGDPSAACDKGRSKTSNAAERRPPCEGSLSPILDLRFLILCARRSMSAISAHLPKNIPFGQLHETVRRVTRKTRQTMPRCVVRGLRTHAAGMREGEASSRREKGDPFAACDKGRSKTSNAAERRPPCEGSLSPILNLRFLILCARRSMSAIPAHLPKNIPFGQLHETVRRVTRKTRQTMPRCVVRGLRTHAAMREKEGTSSWRSGMYVQKQKSFDGNPESAERTLASCGKSSCRRKHCRRVWFPATKRAESSCGLWRIDAQRSMKR